jgi:hypothetical protein
MMQVVLAVQVDFGREQDSRLPQARLTPLQLVLVVLVVMLLVYKEQTAAIPYLAPLRPQEEVVVVMQITALDQMVVPAEVELDLLAVALEILHL